MQNLWPSARTAFALAQLDWVGGDFAAIILTDDYTFDVGHTVVDDLDGIAGTAALTGKTVTDGACDAADVTITPTGPGLLVTHFVIAQDEGNTATDKLIWYANTYVDTTPISRVTDGSGMVWSFDNGADRIFRI